MVYASKFDENSDLSTTYLGQVDMTRSTKIKAEERFPITGQGFTSGKLLGGTDCHILLDTSATKSYMSKSYYLQCKTLHVLPKFSSNTQRIQVGNGQYVSVLFVIPVIIDVHGHRFEIFTLVSEIHDNVDLVMGMKNIFKLEGVIDSRESCFSFLSRSICTQSLLLYIMVLKLISLCTTSIFPNNVSTGSSHITKDGHGRSSFY